MQTFMPVTNFQESSRIIDKKRCWKQCMEAWQMLNGFERERNGDKFGYRNHAAIRMWVGYDEALKVYYNEFWYTCVDIHHYNIVKIKPIEVDHSKVVLPPWIGYEPLHSSHRSRLLQKNYEYYKQFNWKEDNEHLNEVNYLWPVDKSGELLPEIKEWLENRKKT